MPKNQQSPLLLQISRSVLLSDDLQRSLAEALPNLTEEQAATLSILLENEESVLQSIITRSIQAAAHAKDSTFFDQLSALLSRARKTMRRTEEDAEKMASDERTSHLLD